MTDGYHAIVVGGGHNGLVAAAYLAKAGARTVVLEARHKVGGAADTMAPWPDAPEFKVTTLSYVMSLMPDTILRDLDLARHGYRSTPVGPYFLPFPDGRAILQADDDAKKNYESFAQFSKRDADAIEQWDAWIGGLAEVLGPADDDDAPAARLHETLRSHRAAPARVALPRARRARARRRHPADDDVGRRPARPVLRIRPGEDGDGAQRPHRHVGRAVRARHRLRDGPPLDRRRWRWSPRLVGGARGRHGRRERCDRLERAVARRRDPHRGAGREDPRRGRVRDRRGARFRRGVARAARRHRDPPEDHVPRADRPCRASSRLRRRHLELEDPQRRREDQRRPRPCARVHARCPSSPTSPAASSSRIRSPTSRRRSSRRVRASRRPRRSATA